MEYLDYLPGLLRESREFQRLGDGVWPEVTAFLTAAEQAAREGSAALASEEGIGRFERMLGLSAVKGEGLEQRRFRVLNALGWQPPFSMGWLRRKLEQTFGAGGYLAEVSAAEHWLRVGVLASMEGDLDTLRAELRERIPANMELYMSALHQAEQGAFWGALLQTGEIYRMEVAENGAV